MAADFRFERKRGLLLMANATLGTLVRFDEALSRYDRIVGEGPQAERVVMMERGFQTTGVPIPWLTHGAGEEGRPTALRPTVIDEATTPIDGPANELRRLLGAVRLELVPRLLETNSRGHHLYQGFDLYVTWRGGVTHRHNQLSFGQKRLFAFLWYSSVSPDSPVFTDELANGMHAEWVQRLLDRLAGQQAFHAVQNPLLLDLSGPGEPMEISHRFVLCTVEDTTEGRRWRWRNPDAQEARRLHAAWSAGFQSLSEVLRSEGLW